MEELGESEKQELRHDDSRGQKTCQGWDMFLTFTKPSLEKKYVERYKQTFPEVDKSKFTQMLLVGSLIFCDMMFVSRGDSVVIYGVMATGSTLVGLLILSFRKQCHAHSQIGFLQAMDTGHCLCLLLTSWTMSMAELNHWSFLIIYLLRTPLMMLWVVAFGMTISFNDHFLSQLTACMLSSSWVFIFCSRCLGPSSPHHIPIPPTFVEDVSKAINHWLQRATIIGTVDEICFAHYWESIYVVESCWAPVLFVHFFLGYVLPCAAVYCSEAYSRFLFGLEQKDKDFPPWVGYQSFRGSILLAILMSLILGQCLWVVLVAVESAQK